MKKQTAKNISTLKQQNQIKMIELLRVTPGLTKQDIASSLSLSMPTVLQGTNELLEQGILKISGTNESTGGRKAQRLELDSTCAYCIGINISQHHVRFTIIDFANTPCATERFSFGFCDEPKFYEQLSSSLSQFLEKTAFSTKCILGVGLSFPGIIDSEKNMIARSHVFQMENVSLDRFQSAISYPLIVCNDANCCSFTELNAEKENYFYIALNETVGGALIRSRSIVLGNQFQTGEVGHMILFPDGQPCYCGKKGCADPYLSPKVFGDTPEQLEAFFANLKQGDASCAKQFEQYVSHLALLISNVRMLLDTDIVLGGDLAFYLEDYLDDIKCATAKYDYFAREINYLSICSTKKSARSIGAGILALQTFTRFILV